ncbi:MAG: sugar phosphate isomerase/epimerase family protein [Clostridia bacterium]|jgi:sugar phosphate isomerase/epimerase|nr:sugar phosphate isomerase/epimerase [Clostridiaceae bacterium]
MKDFVVAAQLYTLRDYMKTPEDIRKSLKKVSEMGYTAVQISGLGKIDPVELKEITDEYGLKICATHISPEAIANEFDRVVKEHKLWDCKYVGIGGMPAAYRGSEEGCIAFAKEFSVHAKKLADEGLQFIYHNHRFEFEKFNGRTMMDILFEESAPEFGFEIDTYWVQSGGASPVEWIYKVDGRMQVIHFKDMGVKNNEQIMTPIGRGNLPWKEIFEACKKTAVEWAPVEQDHCYDECPFDCLKESLDFCNKMMKE